MLYIMLSVDKVFAGRYSCIDAAAHKGRLSFQKELVENAVLARLLSFLPSFFHCTDGISASPAERAMHASNRFSGRERLSEKGVFFSVWKGV